MEKIKVPFNKKYKIQLISISEEYELGSIKILSDYFLLIHDYKIELKNNIDSVLDEQISLAKKKQGFNKQKDFFYKNYQIFIKKENFVGKMDRIYTMLKNTFQISLCNLSGAHITHIKKLFTKYNNLTIECGPIVNQYTLCKNCDKEMQIFSSSSEIVCISCGESELLFGTVFEDEQFYYQEGQRTKHGTYDPSKHCRFWIERIQARESKSIPEDVIEDVKKCIRRNNIKNIDEITCEEVRKYLRSTKNTNYNEHVPLIRKMITGSTPPQLTDSEIQLIVLIFGKSIKIYEEHKPPEKTNVMYHPYLIYKIIEHILNSPKTMRKRNAILSCIHLQSRETLIENDNVWSKVCKQLDISYIPTDRNVDLNI
jgi:hypothetical protein